MTDDTEAQRQRLSVLVTRPRQQALLTARRLHALGHRAIIDPLLVVRTIDAGPLDVRPIAAVLLTSSNGLRGMDERLKALPVFAVGRATATGAQRAGCSDVRGGDGDGADLARLITRSLPPEAGEVLHLAGDEVRPGVAGALLAAGYAYRQRTVYAALPASALSGRTQRELQGGRIDAALFYSPRTAQTFVTLVEPTGLADAMRAVTAVCLSAAVASPLQALAWAEVLVAASRDQQALLACLETIARRC
jgi:uroporphyrinogen-III synthase